MLELIIYVLSSLGLLNIFLFSPLSEEIKDKIVLVFKRFGKEKLGAYLVQCPTCSGFWVGVLFFPLYYFGLIAFTLPFTISFLGYLSGVFLFPEPEED